MNRFHFGFYTDINIDQRTLNKAETCSVTHEPHWFFSQVNRTCHARAFVYHTLCQLMNMRIKD